MTVKKNLIANYLGQGWAALMGYAFIPLYIKFLGIEAYGLIGLYAVLQACLGLLDIGMTPALSREMARFTAGVNDVTSIRNLLRSIEVVAIAIAAVIGACIALSSVWLASSWISVASLPIDVVARAISIMGLVIALRLIEGIYRSSIIGLQQQVLFNVLNSAIATLRSFGAIALLIWFSASIDVFFAWNALVSVLAVVSFAVITYKKLPNNQVTGRFSRNELRKIWGFASGMAKITFLGLFLTQTDKILLSRMLDLSEYGYYTLAAAVAGLLFMLLSPITQAYYPKLSQLHAEKDSAGLESSYHMGAQLVSVFVGSLALVLIVFSEVFLQAWTQDFVLSENTSRLLGLLVLGNLLNGLMWIPYQAQLAHGWTALSVRMNLIAVLLIVPAILWVTPRYGAEGAAWVWVILNAGNLMIGIPFMYKRILKSEKWVWFIQDMLKPLCAAAAVCVFIRWLIPDSDGIIEKLIVIIVASVLAMLTACLAADHVRQHMRIAVVKLVSRF